MLFIFLLLGLFFSFAAFTTLPFLLLSPRGFIFYFSLAQGCLLMSASFYHGPLVYFKMMLCSKTNGPISMLYFGVTAANIYFSFFSKIGYIYTLGMIALQVLSIFFFLY